MTMLDRMRRHRGWLKWTLGLVCLAMVIFFVPNWNGPGQAASNEVVADVEGTSITVGEFRRTLNSRIQMFQAQGGSLTPEMLKQLGIDRQVLESLIEQRAVEAEARRRGLRVTDTEVREFILRMPGFQENGRFVGYDRYRAVLRSQRPPLSEDDFEALVRRQLLAQKLEEAVTGWILVSDEEADAEYRQRNEKVKLDVVAFQADQFREGLAATDAEIAAHFEKDKERYRIGERRKIRYVLVDAQSVRASINPTPQDVESHYNTNLQQFSNPEQVRASHILLKTEGKDAEAVRKDAEKLLAEVRKGGDFAALATKHSEDEGSKTRGGDLDFFGRGAMVKPFEDAAFAMQVGQVSDLVQTDYGFHIIKVTDKREAGQRPLAEVRDQIVEQLKWQQAQERVAAIGAQLDREVQAPADLEPKAKAQGLTVKESPLFERDDPIGELGVAPQVATAAFELEPGKVSDAIRTPQGMVVFTVTGKEDARVPKLDEIKERVRADVITAKAREAARAKAAEVAAAVKGGASLAAAAKGAGREVRTSELIARGGVVPDVGVSPAIDRAAFGVEAGTVSEPITTDTGAAVIKVVETTPVTDAELATARDSLKRELISTKRNRFFSSYMAKAKERLDIRRYEETLARAS